MKVAVNSNTRHLSTSHAYRRSVSLLAIGCACLWLAVACTTTDRASLTTTAEPDARTHPSLADLWNGRAHFTILVADTGLPMGESDTLQSGPSHYWSFVHASYPSAQIVDSCGAPVAFPGCVIRFRSSDALHFEADWPSGAGQCLIPCLRCPCGSQTDHIDQQQYPQVAHFTDAGGREQWLMVYEYRANIILRRSLDGANWSAPEEIPLTGIWADWLMPCRDEERIGSHPFAAGDFDCLVGSPPGITIASGELFIFVGLGQNPGSMGCYRGDPAAPAVLMRKCKHNPLFRGSGSYGAPTAAAADANPHFDFRTISSASVLRVGDRFYMFYEGVRGPGAGDAGDTQFGLGLARSMTAAIDGPWETYPHNPILVDLPGNVGLGHADVFTVNGETRLTTSLDGERRSVLGLRWR